MHSGSFSRHVQKLFKKCKICIIQHRAESGVELTFVKLLTYIGLTLAESKSLTGKVRPELLAFLNTRYSDLAGYNKSIVLSKHNRCKRRSHHFYGAGLA